MSTLRNSIRSNEKRLEGTISWLEQHGRGLFTMEETTANCHRAKDAALAVLACGKDLLTLLAALEFDVNLYKDTRQRHHSGGNDSIDVVPFGSTVMASRGGSESALRIDDRIVASKERLIHKITEYNNLVKVFSGDKYFRWGAEHKPDFVSMDGA